jgi:hypothetical protein
VLFVFAAFVRNVDLEREIREDDLLFSVISLFLFRVCFCNLMLFV